MRHSTKLLTAAALVALAGCGDAGTLADARKLAPRGPAADVYLVKDSIYTSQTPASTIEASGGWEVGTRFTPDCDGRVVGFRFWKAAGETGSHTARLWNSAGTQVAFGTFSGETASGWQRVNITAVNVSGGQTYLVSVNTNAWQVKTFAYFNSNPINRPWGVADAGAYGQPTGVQPGTISGSSFFVDVYYRKLSCTGPLGDCVPVDCP
jgi:hypothetical protein